MPTLIVWGRNDTLIPVEDAYEFQRLIGDNARVEVFDDTGHLAMVERPTRFNALLDAFIAGCAGARGAASPASRPDASRDPSGAGRCTASPKVVDLSTLALTGQRSRRRADRRAARRRARQLATGCWILPGCVIAPSLALETSAAYFASTPRVTLGAGGS